jgi:hypothetical protein
MPESFNNTSGPLWVPPLNSSNTVLAGLCMLTNACIALGLPEPYSIRDTRPGQCPNRRKTFKESEVEGDHQVHLYLLEHHLQDEDAVSHPNAVSNSRRYTIRGDKGENMCLSSQRGTFRDCKEESTKELTG